MPDAARGAAFPRTGSCSTLDGVIVRAPLDRELPGLVELEVAAGEAFRDVGMPEVAGDARPVEWLRRFTAHGHVWVALEDGDDVPVAYLVAEPVDGGLHVEQVSVHPRAARRGVGRRLIEHVADVARADGFPALTLTTFTEVPWNAPYYQRLGFAVVPDDTLTPGLRRIVDAEAAIGLDRWPRVVMRRTL